MGLQVPSNLDSECRKKVIYGNLRRYLGEVIERTGIAKGMQYNRRASYGGPRSPVDINSSEICGVSSCRLCQREKRNTYCQNVCRTAA